MEQDGVWTVDYVVFFLNDLRRRKGSVFERAAVYYRIRETSIFFRVVCVTHLYPRPSRVRAFHWSLTYSVAREITWHDVLSRLKKKSDDGVTAKRTGWRRLEKKKKMVEHHSDTRYSLCTRRPLASTSLFPIGLSDVFVWRHSGDFFIPSNSIRILYLKNF